MGDSAHFYGEYLISNMFLRSLDEKFVKELLSSKKLIKSRKDLDEIAQSNGYHLRRVTRQFENLKRKKLSLSQLKFFCSVTADFIPTGLYAAVEDGRQWQCNLYEVNHTAECIFHLLLKYLLFLRCIHSSNGSVALPHSFFAVLGSTVCA